MTVGVVDVVAARRFIEALFVSSPAGSLIELRTRRAGGMRQSFCCVEAIDEVVAEITRSAASVDVFVGVVPRARRGGGRRDLVDCASVLWVDCDSPAAAAALAAFRPAPSIVVASGGGRGHRHAYWLLSEPAAIDEVERANRRLVWALGADLACSEPARILRPAGSAWHKASPPIAVRLLRLDVARHEFGDVVGRLEDVPVAGVVSRPRRRAGEDPLLAIAPAEYVERLTGEVVGRSGKVRCPFHEDRTPSLHVFDTPERGWYCFGACQRGGSVYDFAALLWQTDTHGREFIELRERLTQLLLPPRQVSRPTRGWTP